MTDIRTHLSVNGYFSISFSTEKHKDDVILYWCLHQTNMFPYNCRVLFCKLEHSCSNTMIHLQMHIVLSSKHCPSCDLDIVLGHIAILVIFMNCAAQIHLFKKVVMHAIKTFL